MADTEAKSVLKAINLFLLMAFVFTAANYFDISPSMTGSFFADEEDPECEFNRGDYSNGVPIDRCCFHASQKISCTDTTSGKVCGTESQNYSLNQDAVNYCRNEGFNIE